MHELHIGHIGYRYIHKVSRDPLLLDHLTVAIKALTKHVHLEPVEVELSHLVLTVPLELDALVERAEEGSPPQGDLLTPVEMRNLDEDDTLPLSDAGGDEEAVPGTLVAHGGGLEWRLQLHILHRDLSQVHGELLLELLSHLLVDHGVEGGVQKQGMIKRPLVLREDLFDDDLNLILDIVEDIRGEKWVDDHDHVSVRVLECSCSSYTVHLGEVYMGIAALEEDNIAPIELVADVLVSHELLADEVVQVEDDVLVLGNVECLRECLCHSGPADVFIIDTTLNLRHHRELVRSFVTPCPHGLVDGLGDERIPIRGSPVIHVVQGNV